MPTNPITRPLLERLFTRKALLTVYWGAAAILLPWIVVLFSQQPRDAVAHHLHLVRLGVSMSMVGGMFATAVATWMGSRLTILFGTATATLAMVTSWFATVTSTGRTFVIFLIYSLIVLLPVIVLCTWIVWRALRRPHDPGDRPAAVVAVLLAVGAISLAPLLVVLSHNLPALYPVHHLRLVWTGLDVMELIGLVSTGWCLHRGSPLVAVTGAFTGTLLLGDAWFNVVSTTGVVQLAGLALALVELPLSVLSFEVARRASTARAVTFA